MKRPMAWVGLSFFSALILFCIYGLYLFKEPLHNNRRMGILNY